MNDRSAGLTQSRRGALPLAMALAATLAAALALGGCAGSPSSQRSTGAQGSSAAQMTREAETALRQLYAQTPSARTLGDRAVAVLVFPSIVKAGVLVGGEHGTGTLLRKGKEQGHYDISAGSFGLQAGMQTFSYALFFMNEAALRYLDQSDGWAIGAGPSVVVWDQAAAASVTSTTLSQDVYAVPFGQKGLMAGIGLEGSKITRIHPQ